MTQHAWLGWVIAVVACSGGGGSGGPDAAEQQTDATADSGGGSTGGGNAHKRTVAAAKHHTCVIAATGTAWCWGRNQYGERGGEGMTSTGTPTESRFVDVVAIAGSTQCTCALEANGTVSCTGRVVSEDFVFVPVAVTLPEPAEELRAAPDARMFCARTVSGAVYCWGAGQLSAPTRFVDGNAHHLAVGQGHICVAMANGTVSCAGENEAGQLGDGTTTPRSTLAPVTGLADAIDLAAGEAFTCALRAGGSVVCWGTNQLGQLGSTATAPSTTPQPVPGLTNVTAIVAGQDFMIARLTDGTLRAWGSNSDGALGYPATGETCSGTACSRMPTQVSVLGDVAQLDAGAQTACACVASGALYCWGDAASGKLGVGPVNSTKVDTPMQVPGFTCRLP